MSNTRCCFVNNGVGCTEYSCALCYLEREPSIEKHPDLEKCSLLTCHLHYSFALRKERDKKDRIRMCWNTVYNFSRFYPMMTLKPFVSNRGPDHVSDDDVEESQVSSSDEDVESDHGERKRRKSSRRNMDKMKIDRRYQALLDNPEIEASIKIIFKYGGLPKTLTTWANGEACRPGKANNTFVGNVLGLMLWKHMNNSNNTNVKKSTFDVKQPERQVEFERQVIALRKSHSVLFLKIDKKYEHVQIVCTKLHSFTVALNRKWSNHGEWSLKQPGNQLGIYSGQVKVLKFIGYSLPVA